MELQRLHQCYWNCEGLNFVILGLWSPVPAEEHDMWEHHTYSSALQCSVVISGRCSPAPTERKAMSRAAALQQQSLRAEGLPGAKGPAWHVSRG